MNTLTEKQINKLVKNKSTIRPFVELGIHSEKVLDKLGFDITSLHLDKTGDGWLRIYIRYGSKKDEYKFKFAVKGCVSYSYSENYVELEFPQVNSTFKRFDKTFAPVSINVGIQNIKNSQLGYTFKFIENMGYGCLVWFAPEGWNSGENETAMFEFNKK